MNTIPDIGWLQSAQVIWKNRTFYPRIGDHFRDEVGGLVRYRLKRPRYYVTDPELAQKIMRIDYKRAVKPLDPYDALAPYQGNGLVLSKGPDWVKQRRWSSPFFLSANFPAYLKVMLEETESVAQVWSKQGSQPRSIVSDLNRMTFRILCRCILGRVIDSRLDTLYAGIDESIFLVPKRVFAPVQTPLGFPTPNNLKLNASAKRYRDTITEVIEEVRKDPTPGLLSHLLKQSDITQDEIIDMIATMIGAGFETTANLLSWTIAALAQNEPVQTRLQKELQGVVKAGPTVEAIEGAEYLEAVVNESLRVFPPLLVPARKLEEDMELGGHRFPKGTTFDISIWAINRHPDYWDNPSEFRPERFLKENLKPRSLQAFIPFAVGPRECVGKAFALLEARAILALLLSRFTLKLAPGHVIEPDSQLVLRPKYGVSVVISKADQGN